MSRLNELKSRGAPARHMNILAESQLATPLPVGIKGPKNEDLDQGVVGPSSPSTSLPFLLKPCPHCIIKPVSPVSGTGSMCPHYTQFHPTQFYPVPPETFRSVGFKWLRFIEYTCGFIADVSY